MTNRVTHEQLSAYLDGAVGERERRAVEAEIDADPIARATLEDYASVKSLLVSMSEPEPPAGFWESVEHGVNSEMADHRRRSARLVVLSSTAAALVALLFVVALAVPGDDPQIAGPGIEDVAEPPSQTMPADIPVDTGSTGIQRTVPESVAVLFPPALLLVTTTTSTTTPTTSSTSTTLP